jgi:hypothetical protein
VGGDLNLPSGEGLMSEKLEEQLRVLVDKVDRILAILNARENTRQRVTGPRTQELKSTRPTANELQHYQSRFETLFGIWESGEELQVERELDAMEIEDLRRFADANNLTVSSTTSKRKIMELVSRRFRERRQLMRSNLDRRSREVK